MLFRSSIKRPQTSEYTSITDSITVDTEGEEHEHIDEITPQSPIAEHPHHDEDGDGEEDGFSDAPSQSASISSMPEGSHAAALSIASERLADLHRLI